MLDERSKHRLVLHNHDSIITYNKKTMFLNLFVYVHIHCVAKKRTTATNMT